MVSNNRRPRPRWAVPSKFPSRDGLQEQPAAFMRTVGRYDVYLLARGDDHAFLVFYGHDQDSWSWDFVETIRRWRDFDTRSPDSPILGFRQIQSEPWFQALPDRLTLDDIRRKFPAQMVNE